MSEKERDVEEAEDEKERDVEEAEDDEEELPKEEEEAEAEEEAKGFPRLIRPGLVDRSALA